VLHRRPVDPGETLYTLDYYLRLAEQIVEAGAHVLAIKDMAGCCGPAAPPRHGAAQRFDLPVHVHTTTPPAVSWPPTPRPGTPEPRGRRAAAPLAGTTSQPPLSAIVAAAHTPSTPG
jgi:pyruvate carboxylase